MTGDGTDGKLAMTQWGISIIIDKVCSVGALRCAAGHGDVCHLIRYLRRGCCSRLIWREVPRN